MPNFTISPTTGTGDGYLAQFVTITPSSTNHTNGDKVTIASVIAGGITKQVTLTHWGIPNITRSGSGNVPATGATLTYSLYSHYQFYFENIPSWVHIYDWNSNELTAGQPYDAPAGGTANLTFVIGNNSGSTRSATNFKMKHYYSGQVSTYDTTISLTQEAGTPAQVYITLGSPSEKWDWDASGATKTITITSNTSWTASVATNYYEIVGSATGTNNGSITVRAKQNNDNTSSVALRLEDTLTVTNGSITATAALTQYRIPRLYAESNVSGGNISVDAEGDTINFNWKSDYEWWFQPITGQHQDPSFSTEYMRIFENGNEISAPDSSSHSAAVPSGTTYAIHWALNDGAFNRRDTLNIKYTKLDGTTDDAYRNFSTAIQQPYAMPFISVSPTGLTFDWWEASGTTMQFAVSTEMGGGWDYSTSHNFDDFELTKSGNYLNVTTKRDTNTSNSQRYVDITFTNTADTSVTATARVSQYHKPYLYVHSNVDKTIPATGGTREMYISSEYSWWLITNFDTTASTPDVTAELGGVTADIFDSNDIQTPTGATYDLVFSENTETSQRPPNGQGYFEIRYKDRSGNTRTDGTQIAGWIQSGATEPVEAPYLVLITSPSAGIVFNSGSTGSIGKTLQVSASTSWVVSSKPDWISLCNSPFVRVEITGGTSGNSIMYPRSAENSGASRSGYVTISGSGLTATSALISQSAGTQTPTYDDIYIENEEGDLTNLPATGCVISFIYENDGANAEDWEINYDDETDEWAKFYNGPNPSQADEVASLEAGDTGYVYLSVSPNGGSSRNGSITLFGVDSSRTKTITLHQNG